MRQTTLLTLLAAGIMTVALFYLKYEVTSLEEELSALNRTIVRDQEAIHVLRAEWSHLNESERLHELADKYLDLEPTRPDQIVNPSLAAPVSDILPGARPTNFGAVTEGSE